VLWVLGADARFAAVLAGGVVPQVPGADAEKLDRRHRDRGGGEPQNVPIGLFGSQRVRRLVQATDPPPRSPLTRAPAQGVAEVLLDENATAQMPRPGTSLARPNTQSQAVSPPPHPVCPAHARLGPRHPAEHTFT